MSTPRASKAPRTLALLRRGSGDGADLQPAALSRLLVKRGQATGLDMALLQPEKVRDQLVRTSEPHCSFTQRPPFLASQSHWQPSPAASMTRPCAVAS